MEDRDPSLSYLGLYKQKRDVLLPVAGFGNGEVRYEAEQRGSSARSVNGDFAGTEVGVSQSEAEVRRRAPPGEQVAAPSEADDDAVHWGLQCGPLARKTLGRRPPGRSRSQEEPLRRHAAAAAVASGDGHQSQSYRGAPSTIVGGSYAAASALDSSALSVRTRPSRSGSKSASPKRAGGTSGKFRSPNSAYTPFCLGDALRSLSNLLSADGGRVSVVGKCLTSLRGVPSSVAAVASTLLASSNCLASLEGLEVFENLRTLSLAGNLLRYTDNLAPLAALRRLELLRLEGNPVCAMPHYRSHVICLLADSCLRTIDGKTIAPAEAERAAAVVHAERTQTEAAARARLRAAFLRHAVALCACQNELRRVLWKGFSAARGRAVPRQQLVVDLPMDRIFHILRVEGWELLSVQELQATRCAVLDDAVALRTEMCALPFSAAAASAATVTAFAASAAGAGAWEAALAEVQRRDSLQEVRLLGQWASLRKEAAQRLLDLPASTVAALGVGEASDGSVTRRREEARRAAEASSTSPPRGAAERGGRKRPGGLSVSWGPSASRSGRGKAPAEAERPLADKASCPAAEGMRPANNSHSAAERGRAVQQQEIAGGRAGNGSRSALLHKHNHVLQHEIAKRDIGAEQVPEQPRTAPPPLQPPVRPSMLPFGRQASRRAVELSPPSPTSPAATDGFGAAPRFVLPPAVSQEGGIRSGRVAGTEIGGSAAAGTSSAPPMQQQQPAPSLAEQAGARLPQAQAATDDEAATRTLLQESRRAERLLAAADAMARAESAPRFRTAELRLPAALDPASLAPPPPPPAPLDTPRTLRALRDRALTLSDAAVASAAAAMDAHCLDLKLRRQLELFERVRKRDLDAADSATAAFLAAARAEAAALAQCRDVAAAAERHDAALAHEREEAKAAAGLAAERRRQVDAAAERLELLLQERQREEERLAAAERRTAAHHAAAEEDDAVVALRRRLHCERLAESFRRRPDGPLREAWCAFKARVSRQRRARLWWRASRTVRNRRFLRSVFNAWRTAQLAERLGRAAAARRTLDRWRKAVAETATTARTTEAMRRYYVRASVCTWRRSVGSRQAALRLKRAQCLVQDRKWLRSILRGWAAVAARGAASARAVGAREGSAALLGGYSCGGAVAKHRAAEALAARTMLRRRLRRALKDWRRGAKLRVAVSPRRRLGLRRAARHAVRHWRVASLAAAAAKIAEARSSALYVTRHGSAVLRHWKLSAQRLRRQRTAASVLVAALVQAQRGVTFRLWQAEAAEAGRQSELTYIALEHHFTACLRKHFRALAAAPRRRKRALRGLELFADKLRYNVLACATHRWRRKAAAESVQLLRAAVVERKVTAAAARRQRELLAAPFRAWRCHLRRRSAATAAATMLLSRRRLASLRRGFRAFVGAWSERLAERRRAQTAAPPAAATSGPEEAEVVSAAAEHRRLLSLCESLRAELALLQGETAERRLESSWLAGRSDASKAKMVFAARVRDAGDSDAVELGGFTRNWEVDAAEAAAAEVFRAEAEAAALEKQRAETAAELKRLRAARTDQQQRSEQRRAAAVATAQTRYQEVARRQEEEERAAAAREELNRQLGALTDQLAEVTAAAEAERRQREQQERALLEQRERLLEAAEEAAAREKRALALLRRRAPAVAALRARGLVPAVAHRRTSHLRRGELSPERAGAEGVFGPNSGMAAAAASGCRRLGCSACSPPLEAAAMEHGSFKQRKGRIAPPPQPMTGRVARSASSAASAASWRGSDSCAYALALVDGSGLQGADLEYQAFVARAAAEVEAQEAGHEAAAAARALGTALVEAVRSSDAHEVEAALAEGRVLAEAPLQSWSAADAIREDVRGERRALSRLAMRSEEYRLRDSALSVADPASLVRGLAASSDGNGWQPLSTSLLGISADRTTVIAGQLDQSLCSHSSVGSGHASGDGSSSSALLLQQRQATPAWKENDGALSKRICRIEARILAGLKGDGDARRHWKAV